MILTILPGLRRLCIAAVGGWVHVGRVGLAMALCAGLGCSPNDQGLPRFTPNAPNSQMSAARVKPYPEPPTVGFDAECTYVFDGDTIAVLREGEEHRVRIEGIDCPERGQPLSDEARAFTESRCRGRTVHIIENDRDQWDRVIGPVFVEGQDLGQQLLEAGLAWHFARYNNDESLADCERLARVRRLGIWQFQSPEAPWSYRARVQPRERSSKNQGASR